jgi:hypothetical protein
MDLTTNQTVGGTKTFSNLKIYEGTGTYGTETTGSRVLQHGNTGGTSSIIFVSANNTTSDYGYIRYRDDVNNYGGNNEQSCLEIGAENDVGTGGNTDQVILQKNGGYVGIGMATASSMLDVNGVITSRYGICISGKKLINQSITDPLFLNYLVKYADFKFLASKYNFFNIFVIAIFFWVG